MCGIAGFFSPSGFDSRKLKLMSSLLSHRGPDDEGYVCFSATQSVPCSGHDTPVEASSAAIPWRPRIRIEEVSPSEYWGGLAHRRLSIIDLSANGHQPMSYADRYWIAFNGEIYNHVELRAELEGLGHCFLSNSDTEVILCAWAEWGEACMARFNGMWAFAIYDTKEHTLILARDRFGVKPLFMAEGARAFVFASEIKPLLAVLPAVRASVDRTMDYLVTGIVDSTDGPFFEGITKLPAGACLSRNMATGYVSLRHWYSLEASVDKVISTIDGLDDDALIRRFDEIFVDSIRLRLRADVPVGTCLSGGLDSTSIVAVAHKMYRADGGGRFAAITGISSQQDNDESEYARTVAEAFDLRWIRTRPSYEDFSSSIEEVMKTQEEPFGGASIVMQYHVMKMAREFGLPVMLDGQGGDEILLGYAWYFGAWLKECILTGRWSDALTGLVWTRRNNSLFRNSKTMAKFMFGNSSACLRHFYQIKEYPFLRHGLGISENTKDLVAASPSVRCSQMLDIKRTCLPALLRFEDKNSMAFAVEARLPFLDYRLVEYSLALPTRAKMRDGWTKWLLRRWSKRAQIPESIIWRKTKLGFPAPDRDWMVQHKPLMGEEISGSRLVSSLPWQSSDIVQAWLLKAEGPTLWRLYSVALWDRLFFECR